MNSRRKAKLRSCGLTSSMKISYLQTSPNEGEKVKTSLKRGRVLNDFKLLYREAAS